MTDTTPDAAPVSLAPKPNDEESAIRAPTEGPAAVTTASGHRLGGGTGGWSTRDGVGGQTLAAREELKDQGAQDDRLRAAAALLSQLAADGRQPARGRARAPGARRAGRPEQPRHLARRARRRRRRGPAPPRPRPPDPGRLTLRALDALLAGQAAADAAAGIDWAAPPAIADRPRRPAAPRARGAADRPRRPGRLGAPRRPAARRRPPARHRRDPGRRPQPLRAREPRRLPPRGPARLAHRLTDLARARRRPARPGGPTSPGPSACSSSRRARATAGSSCRACRST